MVVALTIVVVSMSSWALRVLVGLITLCVCHHFCPFLCYT